MNGGEYINNFSDLHLGLPAFLPLYSFFFPFSSFLPPSIPVFPSFSAHSFLSEKNALSGNSHF